MVDKRQKRKLFYVELQQQQKQQRKTSARTETEKKLTDNNHI